MEEPGEGVKKDKRKKAEDNEGERDRNIFKDEAQQVEAGGASGSSKNLETDVSMELLRISVDIAEMCSPLRVTKEGEKFGSKVGEAMDLTTGWDFRKEEDQKRAMDYIDQYQPKLVIGSPMCTMFSVLQHWSKWTEEEQRRWCEAREHIRFVIKVYKKQAHEGIWFLH
jgi:hypothetical protein